MKISLELNKDEKKDFILLKNNFLKNCSIAIEGNTKDSPDQNKNYIEEIKTALDLAMRLHADQKPRPDGPYVNHILRVANRMVEDFGIKDHKLIISALLHDSVEDQFKKLSDLLDAKQDLQDERKKALLYIKNNFGERVANIVYKLSNPEKEGDLTQQEKNYIYVEHVQEAIEDSDVLPVKLADLFDNALNLEAVSDHARRLKLSNKYLPVLEIFVKRLDSENDVISKEKSLEIIDQIISMIEKTKIYIFEQNKQNFEQVWNEAIKSNGGFIELDPSLSKEFFLKYISDTKNVILHGSNWNTEELEPRQANCKSKKFGNLNAVYATKDNILPIFYAIKDKDKLRGTTISSYTESFDEKTGLIKKKYHFELQADEEVLKNNPWSEGIIYVLPIDSFEQGVDDNGMLIDEFICRTKIKPLFRLKINTKDFSHFKEIKLTNISEKNV